MPDDAQKNETQLADTQAMDEMAQRSLRLNSDAAAQLALPEKVGKYPILKRLGQGGMGTVYLARHPELEIPVAVKVIKPEHGHDPEHIDRFVNEARFASKLDHPNCVRILDADRHEDCYFIVQEYVEGGNVTELIDASEDKRVSVDKGLKIALGVAKALGAAWEMRIVHRDIKPENILLTRSGEPKLGDMGIAKQLRTSVDLSGDVELTRSGVAMGSPHYMAPEQIRDASEVDIRADIYSLGATLFHMVTGETPFSGTTVRDIMTQRIHQDLRDPRTSNPDVPKRAARLICKMMARRPEDRFQTPEEVVAALERLLQPAARRWELMAAAAALVLLVAFVVAAQLRFRAPTADALAPAEAALVAQDYDAALRALDGVSDAHRSPRALYCRALCLLAKKDIPAFSGVKAELADLPGGTEWAQHLEILALANAPEQRDQALELATQWGQHAEHRLPFLLTRGLLLEQRGDSTEATTAYQEALRQKPLLESQRFDAADALGKHLFRDGNRDAALRAYEQVLGRADLAGFVHPAFYTNYAWALFGAGKRAKATEAAELALMVKPADELALFLKRKAEETGREPERARIKATMEMIDDIGRMVTDAKGRGDDWSTTPLVLTLLPLQNRTALSAPLAVTGMWEDVLTTQLRKRHTFPVVDRGALEELLREHKLAASDLAKGDGALRLGKLITASVLLKGSLAVSTKALKLHLELVDTETSEVIDIFEETIGPATVPDDVCAVLSDRVMQVLADWRTPRGRVKAVLNGVAEISNGQYHGIQPGQVLAVYNADSSVSPRLLRRQPPVAEIRVTDVDKFASIAQVPAGTTPLTAGMLVLPKPDKAHE